MKQQQQQGLHGVREWERAAVLPDTCLKIVSICVEYWRVLASERSLGLEFVHAQATRLEEKTASYGNDETPLQ